MPEILIFYFGGLAASALVALAFYYAIGGPIAVVVHRALGGRAGEVLGRTTRLFLLMTVVVGGLSTQFHGCGGYSDYKSIAGDRRLMFEKSTNQVAGAITYGKDFIVLAAAVGAITIAILARRALPAAATDDTVRKQKSSGDADDSLNSSSAGRRS